MDNHTLTVIPGTWTVEEFDKRVRGFRAALVAYGDVFKVEAASAPAPASEEKKPQRAGPFHFHSRRSFKGQVVDIVTKLKVGDAIFVPTLHVNKFQSRICSAVYDHRNETGAALYVRTTGVRAGDNTGVRVERVA